MFAQTLIETPFELEWGAQVFAKVSATNSYGESEHSELDTEAPLMLRTPDAPTINLPEPKTEET